MATVKIQERVECVNCHTIYVRNEHHSNTGAGYCPECRAPKNRAGRALAMQYPPEKYIVSELTDRKKVEQYLSYRGSACWGQGPISGTEYFLLCMDSARSAGDKRATIVCKVEIVNQIRKAAP